LNKSMLTGTVLGIAVATTVGAIAGYRMLSAPEVAAVLAVTPVTETVKTPREECKDVVVTRQEPIKDEHRIAGSVLGAVAGAVVGEFVGADKGLGYLLLVTNSNMETSLMFATIVALTFIGLAFFYIVEFIESLLIPWHVTHRIRDDVGTM